MEETIKGYGEVLAQLIDKLAGKQTDLELHFKDLTLEVVGIKAKLNGSVLLDVVYASERK